MGENKEEVRKEEVKQLLTGVKKRGGRGEGQIGEGQRRRFRGGRRG
jgi:hypothetical protein